MNFKLFIEMTKMDPSKAMEVLGITHLAGQDFNPHEEEIKSKYRTIAIANHPDRKIGNPQTFKDAAEAWESLQDFRGGKLPGGSSEHKKSYTLADVQNFVQQLYARKFTDYFVRTPYEGYDLGYRTGYMPYGSKSRKNKVPPDATPELFIQGFQRMIPNFPASIMDITVKDKEAWITWTLNDRKTKLQSVSFEPPAAKKTKEAGVGMKVDQIIQHLKAQGLEFMGGGDKNKYYGLSGDYLIRIKARTIRLVHRTRIYSGMEYKGVTDEMYFGQLTPQLLDELIAVLKKKTGQVPPQD